MLMHTKMKMMKYSMQPYLWPPDMSLAELEETCGSGFSAGGSGLMAIGAGSVGRGSASGTSSGVAAAGGVRGVGRTSCVEDPQ